MRFYIIIAQAIASKMLILPGILLLIFIVLTIYYFFLLHRRYQYFSRRGIPTPPFEFFYGHLKTLWSDEFFHRRLENWTNQFGKIYGIYQGNVPTLVVSDADFLHEVFVKQFNVFDGRWDVFGGAGIPNVFGSHGATWRRHRYVINPTFSSAKLKMMSPLINGCISSFMEKLPDHVRSGAEFNIYMYYKRMTMDVICKSILLLLFIFDNRKSVSVVYVSDIFRSMCIWTRYRFTKQPRKSIF